jgi:hypothetical protein
MRCSRSTCIATIARNARTRYQQVLRAPVLDRRYWSDRCHLLPRLTNTSNSVPTLWPNLPGHSSVIDRLTFSDNQPRLHGPIGASHNCLEPLTQDIGRYKRTCGGVVRRGFRNKSLIRRHHGVRDDLPSPCRYQQSPVGQVSWRRLRLDLVFGNFRRGVSRSPRVDAYRSLHC